ncbi:MAG TPA: TonB-dependent receptor [Vicinamibacterales bacterium]|nr:TonB-dependent receptor [Vicinamibacterales bacterium]
MIRRMLGVFAVLTLCAVPAFGQSQAINGTIEGTIVDPSGAVLPGVTVTVTNMDTGTSRSVVTNENGVYRAPLLPLGAYFVSAELSGFRKFEQKGITLAAGQAVVLNISLSVGELTEVVSVVADSPVVDLGRIDQGRTLNEREIKELPLTSRNPYNFALLQPGVTGFETQEFGVPRLTANGALLRVNYQIDGNDNTEKDRLGLRQMPMSEVMIREVKVVTTGYAPEFGQTMGLVYNAITPSGTNRFKGQGSYRLQRKDFAALPFFTTSTVKPPTDVNVFTLDGGGPIVRDRTHFFGGFENARRDFSGGRVITISPANAARLGLNEPPYMPAEGDTKFAIGKVDHQLSQANRLTFRYIFFDNFISNNIGGGISSVQRGTDFTDRQHSAAAQLVSTFGSSLLNEARVQYAHRKQGRVPGSQAGTGPAILVSNVAAFGGPIASNADSGFGFTEGIFQVIDNFTYLRGDHSYKFGGTIQVVSDTRTQTQFQLYTFPNVDAYLSARAGTNPRSYTSFNQFFGEPSYEYDTRMYALFVQDDWRITPGLKLLYGLRYDLYTPPDGVANAPVETSREFNTDRNNWQPRAGFVWTLADQKTVVRANTGLMYDQPINAIYEQAIVNDGTSTRGSVSFTPTQAGAPAFPNVLSGGTASVSNTAWTVAPEFQTGRMWQNNVQIERALGQWYAASLGVSYSRGYDLPVVSNINVTNPTAALPDGRPIYPTAVNAGTRVDPRYNAIFSTEPVGESTYRAMTLQFTRRFHRGIQWDLAYTLGKSEDTAPITSTLSVQGDTGGRTDPSNLERDKGPNILDQRHVFVGSIVAQPEISIANPVLSAILNHNQFGVALLFASGIPVNVRSNRELNNDAIGSDRPNGVTRNSLRLPARKNVDFRYTRRIPLRGTVTVEVLAELKNLFNTVQWSGVSSVVATDLLGNPAAALPTSGDQLLPSGGYEQRQFQLGFKFGW